MGEAATQVADPADRLARPEQGDPKRHNRKTRLRELLNMVLTYSESICKDV
jgi:hypothetical protein